MMSTKLCIWFGLIAGGFVGLLLGLAHGKVPLPPSWAKLALAGLMVAVVAVCVAAAWACLLTHRAIAPVFLLALLIAVPAGILLGPLAYHLPQPMVALVICAVLGLLIGWLVCRFVCSGARSLRLEVAR